MIVDSGLAPFAHRPPLGAFADPAVARARAQSFLSSNLDENPAWMQLTTMVDRKIPGMPGNPDVRIRIFTPRSPLGVAPCVVWFHGGGYVTGDIETDSKVGGRYAVEVEAVVVHVDYRLAPEEPFPCALNDGTAVLRWVNEHAGELAIDRSRVAVAGTSAGGGLAAAIALQARDEGGPPIAFQLLLYPALDDRGRTWSARNRDDAPILTSDMARDMWRHYLGSAAGTLGVSEFAAAARATNFDGLPPTYLLTADLDPLRDEGANYARRLALAGTDVGYRNYGGTFHGFLNLDADVARRAMKEQFAALRAGLHDR